MGLGGLLGGGGAKSKTITVDKEYNARMASIAEKNEERANMMFNLFLYGVPYNPHEKVKVPGTGTMIRNPNYRPPVQNQNRPSRYGSYDGGPGAGQDAPGIGPGGAGGVGGDSGGLGADGTPGDVGGDGSGGLGIGIM